MLDLNIDLTNVDTSYPAAAIGEHHMRVTKVDRSEWAKSPGNYSLVVSFTNVEPLMATSGREIAPNGFIANYRLALQQSDNERAPDFKLDLAKLVESAYGEKRVLNSENMMGLVGKEMLVVFKAARDTTYGETEIKGVKKLA